MRYLLLLLLIVPCAALSQDLKVLRLEYPTATMDMHTTDTLSKTLSDITANDDPLLVAYKGALLTIRAKFTKPIKDKKTYFKKGVAFLEKAIANAPENIEIRCIRLGVQENTPKFLKYKGNMEEDKLFVLENYSSIKNEQIKAFVQGYVNQSKLFNKAEKQLF